MIVFIRAGGLRVLCEHPRMGWVCLTEVEIERENAVYGGRVVPVAPTRANRARLGRFLGQVARNVRAGLVEPFRLEVR